LHLVGCLHRCTGDARSHKHEVYDKICLKKYNFDIRAFVGFTAWMKKFFLSNSELLLPIECWCWELPLHLIALSDTNTRLDSPARQNGPSQRHLTTHNTHKRHPCLRPNSNPQSQQASGRKTHGLARAATEMGWNTFIPVHLWNRKFWRANRLAAVYKIM